MSFKAGDNRARIAGARGGKAAGLKRKRALLRTFLERFPLIGAPLLQAIYDYGQIRYHSGIQARYRANGRGDAWRRGGLASAAAKKGRAA